MKRRNFVQSLLIVPAASVAAEQTAPPAPAPRPVQNPRSAQNVPKLAIIEPDSAAEIITSFFNPVQFVTLNKLAAILVPTIKNNPGALDAHAPEFLDFLISRSPAPDQKLYRNGLDGLNTSAQKHFHKPFAELDVKEADVIIRPLLVARAWERDIPNDPMQHFLVQVHDDLRTATMNSAEWAAAGATGGRGRFNQGRRFYWKPIDPRVGA